MIYLPPGGGSVDGSQIEITGQVAGDVMYFDGSNWIRRAKGNSTQVFTMNGAGTEPVWVDVAGEGGVNHMTKYGLTSLGYRDVCVRGTDIYVCVYGGDIYKQTAGTGSFNALSQTTRNWNGLETLGDNVYAVAQGTSDVYMQTGGTGDFTALSITARDYTCLAAHGSDMYVSVYNDDLYKQTGGTGAFVAQGVTGRNYVQLDFLGDDLYALVGTALYKRTAFSGDFNVVANVTIPASILYMGAFQGNLYFGGNGLDLYRVRGGNDMCLGMRAEARSWVGMTAGPNDTVFYMLASNTGFADLFSML